MDLHSLMIEATTFPVMDGSFALVDTQALYREKAVLDWYTEEDPEEPEFRKGFFVPWPLGLVAWKMVWSVTTANLAAILLTTDDRSRAMQWISNGTGAEPDDLTVRLDFTGTTGTTSGVFAPKRYIAARAASDGEGAALSLTLTSQGVMDRGPSSMVLATLGQVYTPAALL